MDRPPHPTTARRLGTFAAVGVVSTAAYALLYALLRGLASPAVANGIALLVTALGNTAANRRLTFGVRGRASLVRDHVGGLAAFGVALGITTSSIALVAVLVPAASRAVELAVLLAANAIATVVRFVLLRAWIAPVTAPASTFERIAR